jgi:hypothetical protein
MGLYTLIMLTDRKLHAASAALLRALSKVNDATLAASTCTPAGEQKAVKQIADDVIQALVALGVPPQHVKNLLDEYCA